MNVEYVLVDSNDMVLAKSYRQNVQFRPMLKDRIIGDSKFCVFLDINPVVYEIEVDHDRNTIVAFCR